jgi:hypothetical protein
MIEISTSGRFSIAVLNANGQTVYRTTLLPQ